MRGFPFTSSNITVGHFMGVKFHKEATVLVRKVKGKSRNFEAIECGSLYSTFKTPF